MRRIAILALVLTGLSAPADAGWRQRRVNVGRPGGPVLTNVPRWAAERLRQNPGPIVANGAGRRPWISALNNMDTPAARMANYYENGGGAGTTPGYTNGPHYFVPYATWNYPIP